MSIFFADTPTFIIEPKKRFLGYKLPAPAIGMLDETVVLEDAGDSVAYYRDENDVHHVPKRELSSILLSIG